MPKLALLRRRARTLLSDTRGTVVAIFALSLVPVTSLVGAGLDYSRAANVRSQLQNALDAATLAAAHSRNLPDSDLHGLIFAQVDAIIDGAQGAHDLIVSFERNVGDNLLDTSAQVAINTTILGVMGVDAIIVGAKSAVSADYRALEVALVLDNTGSMARRMGTLREAAQNFVDVVTEGGSNDQTSVAIVPYVASVNIGNGSQMEAYLDRDGGSAFNGEIMETRWLGKYDHCSYPNWGTGGSPDYGPAGNDGASLAPSPGTAEALTRLALLAGDALDVLAGATPAVADDPYAYEVLDGCYVTNPAEISHWQLFDQIGVDWKGCVEARPEPLDVTDTPPDPSNPDTLWVPYFWIDDTDPFASWVPRGNNNWIADGPFLNDTDMATNAWGRTHSVLKYASGAPMSIDQVPPNTSGPNKSCGDPILPLTNDYEALTDHVQAMTHWNNGGTQTAQGAAWGWRALSPTPPFTEGSPYGEATKVMVIMTDGENYLVRSDNEAVISDYSAYGHLRWGRYPAENTSAARDYIDQRMLATCANAKAMGIHIYTVTFGLSSSRTRAVWDACATSASMSYHVDTASELVGAFTAIAEAVGDLRLTR